MLEHAIFRINPNAKFCFEQENIDSIQWIPGTSPISRDRILEELELMRQENFIAPEPWNPEKVWKLFLNSDFYERVNAIANEVAPEINAALVRLALAWKDNADRFFWQHRVTLAIFNLEQVLNNVSYAFTIQAHPEEIEIIKHWNYQYSLGLTLPWE